MAASGWVRGRSPGVLLGALMIAAVFVVLDASGIAGTTRGPARAHPGRGGVAADALTEELLFRGYLSATWRRPGAEGRAALSRRFIIFTL